MRFNRLGMICGILVALCWCHGAQCQIVFSARFYYPPGSRKISRYHLYYLPHVSSIGKVTGHVEQLTFGNGDDTDVRFSPNGRYLGFVRTTETGDGSHTKRYLCLYNMAKHAIVKRVPLMISGLPGPIHWNHTSNILTLEGGPAISITGRRVASPQPMKAGESPTGAYLARSNLSEGRHGIEIVDAKTHNLLWHHSSPYSMSGTWVGKQDYVVVQFNAKGLASAVSTVNLREGVVSSTTRQVHNLTGSHPTLPPFYQLNGLTRSGSQILYAGVGRLTLLAQYAGNSTIGPAYSWWSINPQTGETMYIGTAAHLAFSSHYDLFATTTTRRLKPYGQLRNVWVSSLVLHSFNSHTKRMLITGLVSVGSFSWRNGSDIEPAE